MDITFTDADANLRANNLMWDLPRKVVQTGHLGGWKRGPAAKGAQ
jgi:hypothetical protein